MQLVLPRSKNQTKPYRTTTHSPMTRCGEWSEAAGRRWRGRRLLRLSLLRMPASPPWSSSSLDSLLSHCCCCWCKAKVQGYRVCREEHRVTDTEKSQGLPPDCHCCCCYLYCYCCCFCKDGCTHVSLRLLGAPLFSVVIVFNLTSKFPCCCPPSPPPPRRWWWWCPDGQRHRKLPDDASVLMMLSPSPPLSLSAGRSRWRPRERAFVVCHASDYVCVSVCVLACLPVQNTVINPHTASTRACL